MAFPVQSMLVSTIGIALLRRSPERLPYTKGLFYGAIGFAVVFSIMSSILFFGFTLPDALAKVVAQLGLFVLGLRLFPKTAAVRARVLRMALAAVLMSAIADAVIICLASLPIVEPFFVVRQVGVASVWIMLIYGLVNAVHYGVGGSRWRAFGYVGGYVIAALVLLAVLREAIDFLLGMQI